MRSFADTARLHLSVRIPKATLILVFVFFPPAILFSQTPQVKPGIEVLRASHFAQLKGKRIGLITNPTGVDARLKATVDILTEASGVQLVALFGPEHGVRGTVPAGEYIEHALDSLTRLPVYSLYGKTRKPTPEMLKGIDALVYDIQDIGVRSYTYISTMGLAMEAAAENNIEFVVLDRPNPLGGLRVEGNIVEKGFESFVSPYPIPYIYGMTCGELARMLNGEKMLKNGLQCKLTVVPMKGWKRNMTFEQTGLPWVPTSPHIPDASTAAYCAAMGMVGELSVISVGIGYTLPFRTFAAEWIDPLRFAEKLNARKLDGVLFRPIVYKPFYGRQKDKTLGGVQVHITDYARVHLLGLPFICLEVLSELYPDKNPFLLADSSRLAMFDKVAGSDQIRTLFARRMHYEDIRDYLQKDVASFRKQSAKYFLY
jgi:uncharacterized protein YbbC (DUF1343 family)